MTNSLDVNGKRVLVVGLGKSGVASALFLKERGAKVSVSDSKSEAELHEHIPVLLDNGIAVETGGHGERTFQKQDMIVISPGVPVNAPALGPARKLGIPIIGEVELAARFLKGKLVAITGSNGKTTTTALAGDVIAAGGVKTLVGGNIGTPAISLVPDSTDDSYSVLEISSFQLETIEKFCPKVAVVLNVTPDHLDRHGTFEIYWEAKRRIFENQSATDFAVLNADDAEAAKMAQGLKAQLRWFSRKRPVDAGAFVRGERIAYKDAKGEHDVMGVGEMQLKGTHNVENVLAAVTIGVILGVPAGKIREAVKNFKAVEHRLEYVATINGVEFYNDSKATNVDATIKALESFPKNIHIILGGKDKGSDYTVLKPLLQERVKRVYTVGAAAEKIESHIAGSAEITKAGTIEVAVRKALEAAAPGDVVVLAPACASFDQFNSYEHRGQVFKELVRAAEKKSLVISS
ncbi:MAG TPA: UDP-N-acetylmuramoyl-L-alanine--D-glutamate ligase [Terriglobales bacterium]|nr:UDP-N-acetylmuramoyl-L-alanine--D-glutamate ligase [Terriglobales bacterium]